MLLLASAAVLLLVAAAISPVLVVLGQQTELPGNCSRGPVEEVLVVPGSSGVPAGATVVEQVTAHGGSFYGTALLVRPPSGGEGVVLVFTDAADGVRRLAPLTLIAPGGPSRLYGVGVTHDSVADEFLVSFTRRDVAALDAVVAMRANSSTTTAPAEIALADAPLAPPGSSTASVYGVVRFVISNGRPRYVLARSAETYVSLVVLDAASPSLAREFGAVRIATASERSVRSDVAYDPLNDVFLLATETAQVMLNQSYIRLATTLGLSGSYNLRAPRTVSSSAVAGQRSLRPRLAFSPVPGLGEFMVLAFEVDQDQLNPGLSRDIRLVSLEFLSNVVVQRHYDDSTGVDRDLLGDGLVPGTRFIGRADMVFDDRRGEVVLAYEHDEILSAAGASGSVRLAGFSPVALNGTFARNLTAELPDLEYAPSISYNAPGKEYMVTWIAGSDGSASSGTATTTATTGAAAATTAAVATTGVATTGVAATTAAPAATGTTAGAATSGMATTGVASTTGIAATTGAATPALPPPSVHARVLCVDLPPAPMTTGGATTGNATNVTASPLTAASTTGDQAQSSVIGSTPDSSLLFIFIGLGVLALVLCLCCALACVAWLRHKRERNGSSVDMGTYSYSS